MKRRNSNFTKVHQSRLGAHHRKISLGNPALMCKRLLWCAFLPPSPIIAYLGGGRSCMTGDGNWNLIKSAFIKFNTFCKHTRFIRRRHSARGGLLMGDVVFCQSHARSFFKQHQTKRVASCVKSYKISITSLLRWNMAWSIVRCDETSRKIVWILIKIDE